MRDQPHASLWAEVVSEDCRHTARPCSSQAMLSLTADNVGENQDTIQSNAGHGSRQDCANGRTEQYVRYSYVNES